MTFKFNPSTRLLALAALSCSLLLSACGGGGGSDTEANPMPSNQSLTATTNPPSTVPAGTTPTVPASTTPTIPVDTTPTMPVNPAPTTPVSPTSTAPLGSTPTTTISVYAGYSINSDDERVPNSPQAAQNKLTAAGVSSSNRMCAGLSPETPPPGAVTVQIQSSIVIVEILASDLDQAKAVGYDLTSNVQTRMGNSSALTC